MNDIHFNEQKIISSIDFLYGPEGHGYNNLPMHLLLDNLQYEDINFEILSKLIKLVNKSTELDVNKKSLFGAKLADWIIMNNAHKTYPLNLNQKQLMELFMQCHPYQPIEPEGVALWYKVKSHNQTGRLNIQTPDIMELIRASCIDYPLPYQTGKKNFKVINLAAIWILNHKLSKGFFSQDDMLEIILLSDLKDKKHSNMLCRSLYQNNLGLPPFTPDQILQIFSQVPLTEKNKEIGSYTQGQLLAMHNTEAKFGLQFDQYVKLLNQRIPQKDMEQNILLYSLFNPIGMHPKEAETQYHLSQHTDFAQNFLGQIGLNPVISKAYDKLAILKEMIEINEDLAPKKKKTPKTL